MLYLGGTVDRGQMANTDRERVWIQPWAPGWRRLPRTADIPLSAGRRSDITPNMISVRHGRKSQPVGAPPPYGSRSDGRAAQTSLASYKVAGGHGPSSRQPHRPSFPSDLLRCSPLGSKQCKKPSEHVCQRQLGNRHARRCRY